MHANNTLVYRVVVYKAVDKKEMDDGGNM